MMDGIRSRREFLRDFGIGGAAFGLSGLLGQAAGKETRPNIVLILADDMGFSDIGCYGGEIETPNLDRLAAEGLRYTQFYNGARCCPTRASLLTGLYAHQAGVGGMTERDDGVDGYRGDLNRNCLTIAEVLKAAGYRTYMSGKWHVTRFTKPEGPKDNWPCGRGFDRFYGTIIGAGSYFDPTALVDQNEPVRALGDDFYYTDAIGDRAARFILDHAKGESREAPFFLYAAFTAPHWPLQAIEEDIRKYKGRFNRGWDVLRRERLDRLVRMGIVDPAWKLTDRDPGQPPWDAAVNKEWQARRMEVYAAQVDRMDRNVGRILKAIEDTGRSGDTLVIFLSDNGGCHEELDGSWGDYLLRAPVARERTRDGRAVRFNNNPSIMPGAEDTYQSYGYPWANVSNTPFRLYKSWVHEGGISSPFIVRWPSRIRAGNELRSQVGHIIDIQATCVDVAGARYPSTFHGNRIQPLEGTSLVPSFQGRELPGRALFWEHEGNRAVRLGDWKLVAQGDKGPWELYNLKSDRTETSNLAGKEPDRVRTMAALYETWSVRARVVPKKPPEAF